MYNYRITLKGLHSDRNYVVMAQADSNMQALVNGMGGLDQLYMANYALDDTDHPAPGMVSGNFILQKLEREETIPAATMWQSIPLN